MLAAKPMMNGMPLGENILRSDPTIRVNSRPTRASRRSRAIATHSESHPARLSAEETMINRSSQLRRTYSARSDVIRIIHRNSPVNARKMTSPSSLPAIISAGMLASSSRNSAGMDNSATAIMAQCKRASHRCATGLSAGGAPPSPIQAFSCVVMQSSRASTRPDVGLNRPGLAQHIGDSFRQPAITPGVGMDLVRLELAVEEHLAEYFAFEWNALFTGQLPIDGGGSTEQGGLGDADQDHADTTRLG